MNQNLDPCFTCPLPDCDESSPKCALIMARNAYSRWTKRGDRANPPAGIREGNNAWYAAYKLDRDARRSETPA